MGRKAAERAARVEAAQRREQEWFHEGLADLDLVDHLSTQSEARLAAVQERALNDISRPSNPNRRVAFKVLGSLGRLIQQRQEAR